MPESIEVLYGKKQNLDYIFEYIRILYNYYRTNFYTAKNTVISPNFLVWNFCGKARTNRPKLCGNCAFQQNFYTRKLDEITVFFAVLPYKTVNLGT